ncbi:MULTISPECIES: DUF3223 domain-containing protein [unclassified Pseudovibrio]|uniref:DUF3223 domain-containing protein n=1 Tax=unclassified Pseudovibrio TaxID=2627060 RepID=UPI0007AEB391|nr:MULTISPECIES: DUF3223 domain-containing protein [unclassified Pseudovibrio]KZK94105.1 hypothetical protein PsW74_04764 [Pseudovibrio sp. W74]KZL10039.1 hypothetical protein PsAD14_01564 [Pseudovibrio sp. Ad14]
MGISEQVKLGSLWFTSKSKAVAYIREIKDDHLPGDFLSGQAEIAVLDALQRHPSCSEKVGLGVRRIGLYSNGSTRSGHGFGVERVDGSVARFSYKVCFEAQRRSHPDRVSEAFRQAVRPYILRWRDNTFNKHGGQIICPVTHSTIKQFKCHVDHLSPTFTDLVAEFLHLENVDADCISVEISHGEQVEAVFSDNDFRQRWIGFHNKNAKLRIVSIEGHRMHHGHNSINKIYET